MEVHLKKKLMYNLVFVPLSVIFPRYTSVAR
jgi:hypothetical protein